MGNQSSATLCASSSHDQGPFWDGCIICTSGPSCAMDYHDDCSYNDGGSEFPLNRFEYYPDAAASDSFYDSTICNNHHSNSNIGNHNHTHSNIDDLQHPELTPAPPLCSTQESGGYASGSHATPLLEENTNYLPPYQLQKQQQQQPQPNNLHVIPWDVDDDDDDDDDDNTLSDAATMSAREEGSHLLSSSLSSALYNMNGTGGGTGAVTAVIVRGGQVGPGEEVTQDGPESRTERIAIPRERSTDHEECIERDDVESTS